MSSTQPTKAHMNPDEEEDIDDLDDVLDQFKPSSASKQQTSSEAAASSSTPSTSKPSTTTTDADAAAKAFHAAAPATSQTGGGASEVGEDGLPSEFDDLLTQQFAKELAKGMGDVFGKEGGASGGSGAAATGAEGAGAGEMSEEEMMKQFEKIMAEMGLGDPSQSATAAAAGASSTAGGASSSKSAAPAGGSANFQDTIKSTMDRLRQSDAAGSSSGGGGGANPFGDFSDEDMAKLLQGLGGAGGGLDGMDQSEEGMAKMLEKMMGELMSKEVLYEPLKELRDKYPPYLASPPSPISPEDRRRYEEQHRCVASVIEIFENPQYESGSEETKAGLQKKVGELMNEMQESGAPPPEVVGDMPEGLEGLPGFGGGADGKGDEECTIM